MGKGKATAGSASLSWPARPGRARRWTICSSRQIRPSRTRTTRRACAAMSGSWVIRTTVLPASLSCLEDADDLLGRVRVEVAGRLVGEQDGRIGDQGAGDRHALLLAAGELRGVVVLAAGEADPLERGAGAAGAFARREAEVAVEQRQLDVLGRPRPRQQVEALEDEADLGVADLGPLVAVEPRDVDAVEPVAARGRPVEAADDVHQRRLARAGRAHDGHELAARDRQADPLERGDLDLAHVVDLGQVVDLDDRSGCPWRLHDRAQRRPRPPAAARRTVVGAGRRLDLDRGEAGDDRIARVQRAGDHREHLGVVAVGDAGADLDRPHRGRLVVVVLGVEDVDGLPLLPARAAPGPLAGVLAVARSARSPPPPPAAAT